MSPSIWTRCAGSFKPQRLSLRAWRNVEAQHVYATRALVGSAEDQELLETILEESKPKVPGDDADGLHYLLYTPFRYPVPLKYPSRFGTRQERGLWYGSENPRTSFAETAYYRLAFLEASDADLGDVTVQRTLFSVQIKTAKGVDLTRAPFAAHGAEISSPASASAAQELGKDMRAARIEAFLYRSARDREGGRNVGVLSGLAFAQKRPTAFQTWTCVANKRRVEFTRTDLHGRDQYVFDREQFEIDGHLPRPVS